jgi:hypothetical protein
MNSEHTAKINELTEENDGIDLKLYPMEQNLNEEKLRICDLQIKKFRNEILKYPYLYDLQRDYKRKPNKPLYDRLKLVMTKLLTAYNKLIFALLNKDIATRRRDLDAEEFALFKSRKNLGPVKYEDQCKVIALKKGILEKDEIKVLTFRADPTDTTVIKPFIYENELAVRYNAERNVLVDDIKDLKN